MKPTERESRWWLSGQCVNTSDASQGRSRLCLVLCRPPRRPDAEYKGGSGARLSVLAMHDDAAREYAYGPAQGLPDSKVGTFTQDLYDEATRNGWMVISMKSDWKRIFAFD
jgi:hypothetical protein